MTQLNKDATGRLATFGDLLGSAFAGLAAGTAVLLIFEAVMALTGLGEFGESNGWLILILPVWLFVEEFRAEGFGAHRIMVAGLAAGFGVAMGMSVAGVVAGVAPALVSGGSGALTGTVVYCLVWFYGLRWLSHRSG
ncbi:hypothetical protein [Actinoplanes derwentensis]|uniref:Uncharacterized protein n=1 Tax=Actinoplanes derwentensis TaxID=113562 RepID=A0A1H2CQM7_9ACTN|nr:hypothetical protein [Actinoplanes derwentensis]GID83802.1 hypothetical protein Ade03nite_27260 [Actinoplanes derwentensis]SDT72763.1 hypothetical protein SAMN04489716_6487 [Actinoplanes derwentensis]